MRELFATMAVAARSHAPVHIHGETGTGKERVARGIHEGSTRSGRPFTPINAAGLTDELFESTLFGHARGAFTGAVSDRPGLVAATEGGTLFLDEVSELSPLSQARLLRFLQEREYRRVGETHLRHADVRIVTAANASLRERVRAGRFREDLMYRLGILELNLPPLRERGPDVTRLAAHFLHEAARRDGRAGLRLGSCAQRALAAYPWPGNVRELESEMTRAALFAVGPEIVEEDLSRHLRAHRLDTPASLAGQLADHERRVLLRTLEGHAGNRTRAARALGITRQALYGKLRRLGLAPPVYPPHSCPPSALRPGRA